VLRARDPPNVHLPFVDHRAAPVERARALGISEEAVRLHHDCEVIDLHLDSFIWTRVFGYDLRRRHGAGLFGGDFLSQADFPRVLEAGVTGAMWSITTQPLRTASSRARAFSTNLDRLRAIFASVPEQFEVVRDLPGYRAARAAGRHAAMIAVQGGNAVDATPDTVELLGRDVIRVTLVHLSSSRVGATSSPLRRGADAGLSAVGREMVESLDARRILVDLAHVSRRGFFDAVAVHDRSLPLVVTHTGVCGVHPHWRNLDDEQLRAIADSGGTVGIMFQSSFLDGRPAGTSSRAVVDHLAHVVETVGEDHASIGSDFDGAIVPPDDLRSCLELPRLVQHMLDRGWSDDRIRKILGGNFLRVLGQLRG